ncbi:MAG: RHS repeat-associated core domain-containing protein [Acidobacteriaceae bacterium]|nr:RHS repeat-associated core domain-containing protein [Acidobacteriaceae bacterium]
MRRRRRCIFYGVDGARLGAYGVTLVFNLNPPILQSGVVGVDTYFGKKRLGVHDRVGSTNADSGGFFPYGEDKGTVASNDSWKFATYWRDSVSGLDYAVNRYYSSTEGRFLTPDPSGRVRFDDAQTWNKYSYTAGDPANHIDPSGLYYVDSNDSDWWDWGWWWGGIGIIDGAGEGAGAGAALLGPDPSWKTPGQVTLKVAKLGCCDCSSFGRRSCAREERRASGSDMWASLAVVSDCYIRQIFGGGSAVRERTYEVLDEFGQPYKSATLTVNEHNYVQSGSLRGYNSAFYPDSQGYIYDDLSRGGGSDTVEFQQFTATNTSGLNSFSNIPVMVYDPRNPNGPYFGTLGITLRQHDVFINGSDRRINGQLEYCQ